MTPEHLHVGDVFRKKSGILPRKVLDMRHQQFATVTRVFYEGDTFTVLWKEPHPVYQLKLVVQTGAGRIEEWVLEDHAEFWMDFDYHFEVV